MASCPFFICKHSFTSRCTLIFSLPFPGEVSASPRSDGYFFQNTQERFPVCKIPSHNPLFTHPISKLATHQSMESSPSSYNNNTEPLGAQRVTRVFFQQHHTTLAHPSALKTKQKSVRKYGAAVSYTNRSPHSLSPTHTPHCLRDPCQLYS